ncbi:MAG: hypothetical protein ABL963_16505, partial [Longimicrobiales bacterium]
DYDTELYAGWRSRVRAYADSTRAPYADLVETLRQLTPDEASALFIPDGEIGAPHLNEAGNEWVARHLLATGAFSLGSPTSPSVSR